MSRTGYSSDVAVLCLWSLLLAWLYNGCSAKNTTQSSRPVPHRASVATRAGHAFLVLSYTERRPLSCCFFTSLTRSHRGGVPQRRIRPISLSNEVSVEIQVMADLRGRMSCQRRTWWAIKTAQFTSTDCIELTTASRPVSLASQCSPQPLSSRSPFLRPPTVSKSARSRRRTTPA